jgi:hypothetical protein
MARNTISLENIVNDFILGREQTDYDTANKKQLMMYGKQAIRDELAIALGAYLKSVKLTVNTTLNTIALPSDYIEYTKIGVLDKNCQVQVLGLNEKINFAGTIALDGGGDAILDADGIETLNAKSCTPTSSQDQYTGVFFNSYEDEFVNGRLFGLGGGNNARGYYRFNPMDNRIELNSEYSYDYIILEYIADESMSSNPHVPIEAEDYIRKYIFYRSIQRKMNVPQSAIAEAKNNAYLAKKQANFQMKMFNKGEVQQQINRRFQLAPKFANN